MYNEEQLVINSADGITIPAIYASNKERKAKKVIILLHGISSYKDEYLDFYKTLSEIFIQHDFATLRFDFRGHGESKEPPAEFTIASQIIDLSTVIKYIEKEKQYPSVDLLGCSFGAPPCIFASSLFNTKIDNVNLIAPILDYNKTFINPNTEWGKTTFANIVEKTIFNNEKLYMTDEFYVKGALVTEMCLINIENAIKLSEKKFTVMHGDCDDMVDCGISKEIAARNSNIELHIFENMEHGFTDKGDEDGTSPATKKNINRMVSLIMGV